MRKTAFALLLAMGLLASEHALGQKSSWKAAVRAVSPSVPASAPSAPASGSHHHGHHHHSGSFVGVGVGFGYPWWYAPPYPYYVPVVEQPITWLEQDAPPVPAEPAWWYYCDASASYYPSVRECPSGWQRVAVTPPTQ